jgi:hypothetical protein
MITESEMKPTKSGDGRYLQLTFQILEGPYKNRFVWARLNLHNANATAVQIARSELSAICRAVGVLAPKDSCELHNLPVTVHVRCKKRVDTDEVVNEIRGYSPQAAFDIRFRIMPPHSRSMYFSNSGCSRQTNVLGSFSPSASRARAARSRSNSELETAISPAKVFRKTGIASRRPAKASV